MSSPWLACRALLLLQPALSMDAVAIAWSELQAAAEQMMAAYFEGMFCGGCSCLEQLAGKVLT